MKAIAGVTCALVVLLIVAASWHVTGARAGLVEEDDATEQKRMAASVLEPSEPMIPLTDMEQTAYLGFRGGLYPGGSNRVPHQHRSVGRALAERVQPLDVHGNPDPGGKYVLLSIGMSNTTQEFCSKDATPPCTAWSFMGQAASDPEVNTSGLVIVNGARGGQAASAWESPAHPNYDRIRDTWLALQGLSEKQVQVVWLKVANARPTRSLPAADADAYELERRLGNIVRALKVRYPNLKLVFLSSRIYAGYATTNLNSEPYAYESAFAVKWLIEAQIRQIKGRPADERAGDLNYNAGAPWLAWGPYLWAAGTSPRSDGLTWKRADFESDGTHPARSAEEKVGRLLLTFFKSSPYTRGWFVNAASDSGESTPMLTFSGRRFTSYDQEDVNGSIEVHPSGTGVILSGNTWKKMDFEYLVTSSIVMEFEFFSPSEGEIHGIGFEKDNLLSNGHRIFKLYGTEKWERNLSDFDTHTGSGWQPFMIPVGRFYTGPVSYLVFANDHDVAQPTAKGYFRYLRIYEADGAAPLGLFGEEALESPQADGVLLENYPEPFNSQTTIQYLLREQAHVNLEVFDAVGRRVALLVDQEQTAGPHELVFDAQKLPSGIYFCRLQAGTVVHIHQMTLIK